MTATLALDLENWFTLGALLCLFLLLLRGLIRLRGTTLTAACLWALGSTLSLAVVAYLANYPGNEQIGEQSAWRFAALVTTLCPLMAVLGAKRPQDKGWQWVVASLWLVLIWPAGQAVLSRSGGLDLFIAWKLFLFGLIALGPLNYLPTRFWLAAILVSLGQTSLLSDYLWAVSEDVMRWLLPVGVACLLLAAAIVSWQCRLATPLAGDTESSLATYTRQWKNFRDAYGAFWALRILARINQTAELSNWPVRLTWTGFDISEDDRPTTELLTELDQAMSTLLRRFT
jgi:hypothetical protein